MEGARVAIVARDEERLRAAAAGMGPEVLAVHADTTDDAAVRTMVEEVVDTWGGVDVLVNAAAQPAGGSVPALEDITTPRSTRTSTPRCWGTCAAHAPWPRT